MKKLALIIVAAVMCLAFAGCGNDISKEIIGEWISVVDYDTFGSAAVSGKSGDTIECKYIFTEGNTRRFEIQNLDNATGRSNGNISWKVEEGLSNWQSTIARTTPLRSNTISQRRP